MNKYLENLASYMAENNPRGVNKLAYEYGYIPPVSKEGREGMIMRGVMDEGENFLLSAAKYHPDRDLILSASYSNADGSFSTTDATTEPNVIDLKGENKATVIVRDNAEIIRIILILALAFVVYKTLS